MAVISVMSAIILLLVAVADDGISMRYVY